MPIFPGRDAWSVNGRFYRDEQEKSQVLGYFLHLEGVRAALFNGEISEASACLTFRSAPFEAQPVTNAIDLNLWGDFSIYLNPAGGGDFQDPDSFSRGSKIAVFHRTRVVDSVPFVLDGETYNFRDLLPNGVMQLERMDASPLAIFPPYTHIVAFSGLVITPMVEPSPGLERRVRRSFAKLAPDRVFHGCTIAEDHRTLIVRIYSHHKDFQALMPTPYQMFRFDSATGNLSPLKDKEAAPYRLKHYR